jgi:transposase-like protein
LRPSTDRCGSKRPRERKGSFEPQIIRKGQRRFEGFDDKILALYSRGLSTRDIEAHLAEIYGVQVGRDLISRVTDAVMDDVREWQQRPLDDVYPVVFLDALVLKVREGGSVQRRACYLALGVTVEGDRDVLGIWFQETEGAKFWMQVLSELKQRGLADILVCRVDGLKGFPEAIEAIYPNTVVQTCVVHLIRHSLKYVPRREREQVARDLKPIYTAVDADAAQAALEAFDDKWGSRFPVITQAWLNAWEYVTPFLAFRPKCAGSSTRRTRWKGSTGSCAKQSRPKDTSPTRRPDLPRYRQRRTGVDTNAELDDSTPRVQNPLRRPPARINRLHRKSDALSREYRNDRGRRACMCHGAVGLAGCRSCS